MKFIKIFLTSLCLAAMTLILLDDFVPGFLRAYGIILGPALFILLLIMGVLLRRRR